MGKGRERAKALAKKDPAPLNGAFRRGTRVEVIDRDSWARGMHGSIDVVEGDSVFVTLDHKAASLKFRADQIAAL